MSLTAVDFLLATKATSNFLLEVHRLTKIASGKTDDAGGESFSPAILHHP
jgi:hypothetical protein